MCGISGLCLNDPAAPVPQDLLHRMTDVLAHRGPDGYGYLVKGNVGLGHRRLSIIDVSGGTQPIYNEDGNVGIVFNGEIYNYVELMADLQARGHRFATHSDTEVIIHLYEEYGERCVDQLRGMFAFAIWDGRQQCVFIARDRFGIKPLFYHSDEKSLSFASELKSIIEDRSIPRHLDPQAVREYLLYGYVPGDRCILRGIHKLAPGCTLIWRPGKTEIKSYWDVSCSAPAHPQSEAEYLEEFEHLLLEAVKIHLRSDVPLGVFLSGGIDSSSVVALSCMALGGPVKTFSVGFAEEDFSELAAAKLTAQKYQTDHHEIMVRDDDISVLPDIVWHLDEPFADPSALPTYFVCRASREHVKVCLSGDGADELFGGYSRYHDAMSLQWVDSVPRAARRALLSPVAAVMPQAMWGRGFIQRLTSDGAERYLGLIGIFSPSQTADLLSSDVLRDATPPARILEPYFAGDRDILSTVQHADQKTYLPDDILVKVDRMSMQTSLEVRPPFLDHKVAEFANRCPPDLKMKDGVGKIILKRLMKDRLPPEILGRKKMGFGIPIKHWFRGAMKDYAHDMLLGPGSRTRQFLKPDAVQSIVKSHSYEMRDFSRRIWALLVLEQWCRKYGI